MPKKNTYANRKPPTTREVAEYELLYPLLESLLEEVRELSKKKQDGVLNTLKVKMINKVLIRIKEILKEDAAAEFVALLDEDTLPTNSDALFMLVQFKSAMDQYKKKYHGGAARNWTWETID